VGRTAHQDVILLQRFTDTLSDLGGVVVESKHHSPPESLWAGDEDAEVKGSAAIHASCFAKWENDGAKEKPCRDIRTCFRRILTRVGQFISASSIRF
jgi:hypothetical protein